MMNTSACSLWPDILPVVGRGSDWGHHWTTAGQTKVNACQIGVTTEQQQVRLRSTQVRLGSPLNNSRWDGCHHWTTAGHVGSSLNNIRSVLGHPLNNKSVWVSTDNTRSDRGRGHLRTTASKIGVTAETGQIRTNNEQQVRWKSSLNKSRSEWGQTTTVQKLLIFSVNILLKKHSILPCIYIYFIDKTTTNGSQIQIIFFSFCNFHWICTHILFQRLFCMTLSANS